MADFLRNGVAWLAGQLVEHAAETVLYCRGEQVVTIPAVPARVNVEVLSEEGFDARARAMDWIVPVDRLVFDGARTEPAKGDRISTTGAAPAVYEVAAIVGSAHFEPADAYSTSWRIHSKLVSGTP